MKIFLVTILTLLSTNLFAQQIDPLLFILNDPITIKYIGENKNIKIKFKGEENLFSFKNGVLVSSSENTSDYKTILVRKRSINRKRASYRLLVDNKISMIVRLKYGTCDYPYYISSRLIKSKESVFKDGFIDIRNN